MRKTKKMTALCVLVILSSIVAPLGVTREATTVPQYTKEESCWLPVAPATSAALWWQSKVQEIELVEPPINQPIEKYTRAQVEHNVYEKQQKKLKAEMREFFISLVQKAEKIAEEKVAKRRAAKARKKKEELKNLKRFYEKLTYDKTDMTHRVGISKKLFIKILNALKCDYEGVFKESSTIMWDLAKEKNFNEFLLPGTIANESGWGQKPAAKNNYTSQRIPGTNRYFPYETLEKGHRVFAENLAQNYLREDGEYYGGSYTLQGINELYCEPLEREDGTKEKYGWAEDVASCIRRIIGDYLDTL